MTRVEWYVVPDVAVPDRQGEKVGIREDGRPHQIVLVGAVQMHEMVVRHECSAL
jgi:hypothetical protein